MFPDELRGLPRPLAFVLPGGGALGGYQVGVLKALAEQSVVPDLLVGVSAGAVNAALFSWNSTGCDAAVDTVRRVEKVWRDIRRRDMLRLRPGHLALALAGRMPSALDNRHGRAFLRRHLGARPLEDAPVRLALVATDLATGEAVALTEGDTASAVLASSAFPGVYPPVVIGDRTFIDGGVVADIPLDLTASLGAASAIVIMVPALARSTPPKRAIDILLRASTLGVEAHGRTVLRRPPESLRVVQIPAPPSELTTFEVDGAARMIDEGYAAASAWLNQR